jgi:hypothetical protein
MATSPAGAVAGRERCLFDKLVQGLTPVQMTCSGYAWRSYATRGVAEPGMSSLHALACKRMLGIAVSGMQAYITNRCRGFSQQGYRPADR